MLQNCCFALTNNFLCKQQQVLTQSVFRRQPRKTQSLTHVSQLSEKPQLSAYQILKNSKAAQSKIQQSVRIKNITQVIKQNRSKTLSIIPEKRKRGIQINSGNGIKNLPQSTQVIQQSYRSYNQLSIRNSIDIAVNAGFSEMLKSDQNSKQFSPINMHIKQPQINFQVSHTVYSCDNLVQKIDNALNQQKEAHISGKFSDKTNNSQSIINSSRNHNKGPKTLKGCIKLRINSQQLISGWNQAKISNLRGVKQSESRLFQQQANRIKFKNNFTRGFRF